MSIGLNELKGWTYFKKRHLFAFNAIADTGAASQL